MDGRLGEVVGVLGADDDVAELARAGRRAGAVDREREHVGGLVAAAVVAVELADPLRVDELDREVAVVDPGRARAPPRPRRAARRDVGEVELSVNSRVLSRSRVLAVGGDDPLHELVADDVLAAEADEGDVVDRGEDLADDDQARSAGRAAGRSG